MKSTIIGLAILIMATTAGYSAKTCAQSYSDCVAKTKDLGPEWEPKCKAALAEARKTGVFVGPHTGANNPCTP
jgi:hypothetical protein